MVSIDYIYQTLVPLNKCIAPVPCTYKIMFAYQVCFFVSCGQYNMLHVQMIVVIMSLDMKVLVCFSNSKL